MLLCLYLWVFVVVYLCILHFLLLLIFAIIISYYYIAYLLQSYSVALYLVCPILLAFLQ